MAISQQTYNEVEPWARQYGVPDSIWQTVVQVESGGNPHAYNPSGAYGLFQLLTPGGQGDNAIRAGHNTQDLYDPGINAQYGMPSIASAYQQVFKSGGSTNDVNAWIKFAALSGHPGGSPSNSYTQEVGKDLRNAYEGNSSTSNTVDNTISLDTSNSGIPNPVDTLSGIQQILSIVSLFTLDNIKSALFKTGLFIVAAILVVVGFIVIAQHPNGGDVDLSGVTNVLSKGVPVE